MDDFLGPAHVLVGRSITHARPRIPEGAIHFEMPLLNRLRDPRGNDLVHPETIRRLLTWFPGGRAARPDLAVILVDRDGLQERRTSLLEAVRDLPVTKVVGVAIEEFESWLVGDPGALSRVLPRSISPPEIESLAPREAKDLLQRWTAGAHPNKNDVQVRKSLAAWCDLAMLQRRCPSFGRFLADLSAALPQ